VLTFIRSFAILGAILSTLAFLTSPFVQQAIVFPSRFVEDPSQECSTSGTSFIGNPVGPDVDPRNGLSITARFAASIFALSSASGILTADCPTTQCSFPTFNTLGMCVKVNNITSKLTTTRINNSTVDQWVTWADEIHDWNGTTDAWNMSLPMDRAWVVTPVPYVVAAFGINDTISFGDDSDLTRTAVYNFVIMYMNGPELEIPSHNKYPIPEAQALEVMMYMCVQTLDIDVAQGQTRQTLTASSYEVIASGQEPASRFICMNAVPPDPLAYCGPRQTNEAWNETWLVLRDPAAPNGPSNFTTNYFPLITIRAFLADLGLNGWWAWSGPASNEIALFGEVEAMVDAIFGEVYDDAQIWNNLANSTSHWSNAVTNV
jgi:hypothetical protein